MSFANLGLNPSLLKTITSSGYTEPTAVQVAAIPAALAGHDLLVSSHTGSGKTAAFLLPSLQRISAASSKPGKGPRVLVLTPTRELAQQVEKAAWTYGAEMNRLRTAVLVGGSPYALQLKKLKDPVDIVVATPGRLMDHMQSGRIDFSRLEVLVLDEADRMLDMGFIDDIQTIVASTPETRQTLLFSATLDGVVGNLARKLTRNPQRIEVATPVQHEARIDQRLLFADNFSHKNKLLDALLRDTDLNQALIFTATKRGAEELAESLFEQGFAVDALHGDMQQSKRNRTLQRLRDGRTRVLVATDVAARGIDVAGISHVINFDLPRQAEDYVHRIGRTGRAGRTGSAITLVNHSEKRLVRDIERYTSQTIRIDVIAGLEPTPRADKPATARRPSFGDKPKKPFAARGNDRFDGARKASPSTGSKPRAGAGGSGAPWSGGFRNDGPRTNAGPSRRRFSE
ncbi:MAG: RNA helicase [Betaproteobacteria bacterium RBG_16_58_11]|nr:MAG: RNA helicase [Betaproteobacteria bacterium RBG_16_58_11]OFZ96913.1 MAG: RNA helicase [Betaproteobacteria bacterium RBG_19FT_COMBO_58_11]